MPTLAPRLCPRWILRALDDEAVQLLGRAHRLPACIARLLVGRALAEPADAERFLRASAHELHDPALLPGMEAATERLARAIADGETILVHGDYDVDGVTGTALLVRLLRLLGARTEWHIPNRLTDGYSFGPHSQERAAATGARVVISVDNGTSSFETIAALMERGVDVIVTDHHEPPPPHPLYGDLPPATAIVNPKLPSSTYPWRELCGGAVAFKLAWGLCQRVSGANRVRAELKRFLEDALAYVAIATISDVVPLVDENRVFARWGLRSLESTRHAGLRALLEAAGVAGRPLCGDDVGFQIGPRINAAGRLGSARRAVALLLAEEPNEARSLAQELDALNAERKRIEAEVLVEARAQAADYADADEHPVLVVAGDGWHPGVVGIVAARLVEEFARPAIVIGLDGERGVGSARTVPGFHVLEAMRAADGSYVRYGGHAQAAGCELRRDALEDVRAAVCARARELLAGAAPLDARVQVDAELPLPGLTDDLGRWIDRLGPFGEQNHKPILLSRGVHLAEPPRAVGAEATHLALRVRHGSTERRAIAFRMAHRIGELRAGEPLDVVYTPRFNWFRGEARLELELVDFEAGTGALAASR